MKPLNMMAKDWVRLVASSSAWVVAVSARGGKTAQEWLDYRLVYREAH